MHGAYGTAVLALTSTLGACSHDAARPSPSTTALHESDVVFAPEVSDAGVDWVCRGSDGVARAHIFNFDNGPDDPSEGLRRYVDKGKMGFVDLQCRIVIHAAWDFVEAFADAHARVCVGCSFVPDGEHRRIEGGKWSSIDHAGREVR